MYTRILMGQWIHTFSWCYDGRQGRYNLAYERGLEVLSTREKLLGPEHSDTLLSMNNLASVLHVQGKYGVAEEMHRRALELRRCWAPSIQTR
jgi:hypothetical protein